MLYVYEMFYGKSYTIRSNKSDLKSKGKSSVLHHHGGFPIECKEMIHIPTSKTVLVPVEYLE